MNKLDKMERAELEASARWMMLVNYTSLSDEQLRLLITTRCIERLHAEFRINTKLPRVVRSSTRRVRS